MFVKTIGTLLLLGFFYVQLGTSLQCYSCNTPIGCRSTSLPTITCNFDYANATSAHLGFYYKENLTSLASTNFECFHHNLTSASTNVTYKGCLYRQIEPCGLSLRDEYSSLKRTSCFKCAGNLCNPAGTFSSSTVTIFVSMIVIAVYKVLKM